MAGIKSESVAGFIPESVADFLRNQQRVEIITGPERRRSWSEEQQRAIVAHAARKANISFRGFFKRRKETFIVINSSRS
jgi:hypothetical protein